MAFASLTSTQKQKKAFRLFIHREYYAPLKPDAPFAIFCKSPISLCVTGQP
ncbi:hypothetical protein JGUZn3_06650 [Entomobacter blattae]|uniref:Uncharacterized protein n=1 Tax=Entomobacter blattae TaxID=2762277 RepID=A0A7H1NQ47_9PROT|nr:hypothetical protein JGUZn3_06650 [Entomobacter blattae]